MTTTEKKQKGDTSIQNESNTSDQISTNGNAKIEKNPKIGYTRNEHGIKVKRWCASCLHMEYDKRGNRRCTIWDEKVKGCSRCKKWAMKEGLQIAGIGTGVVRDKETKEVILH